MDFTYLLTVGIVDVSLGLVHQKWTLWTATTSCPLWDAPWPTGEPRLGEMMVMGGLFKGASCSHHNRSFTYHRGGGGEEEEGDKEVKKEEEAVEVVMEEVEGEEGGDDDHGRPLQVGVLFPTTSAHFRLFCIYV